jgi:hypothetical protein
VAVAMYDIFIKCYVMATCKLDAKGQSEGQSNHAAQHRARNPLYFRISASTRNMFRSLLDLPYPI